MKTEWKFDLWAMPRYKFDQASNAVICEGCGGWNECNCERIVPGVYPQTLGVLDEFHGLAVKYEAMGFDGFAKIITETINEILDRIESGH